MPLLNCSLLRVRISKIINDVLECCYFFAKYSLDSISLEIVNRHALSYVLVQVNANAPLVRMKLARAVNENPDSDSDSCLFECSQATVIRGPIL